ncbi:zinc finger protein 431-like isoform X2 [Haliotis rubra]|uniref:zinc finger protein 431-like isoform X2 n=1 Tax=Haliotis rubra TaxID=36100 RepID=UPI001EE50760|nr:zinc finger protein 431-like isoform X2 [Haliotis rubra]
MHFAEGKLKNQKNLKRSKFEFSVKWKKLKRASNLERMTKTLCRRYRMLLFLKNLYLSQNLHHTSSHSYACTLCKKDFKRFSTWRLHTISVHLSQKRKLQGQRSKVKVLLKEVKGQNKKRKPSGECLLCTECGSAYSLRKTLKFHLMQVHHMSLSQVEMNSALLVNCEIEGCHFASIDYGELERHAKLEHPDVKYKCTHCQRPRMFHLKAMLDKHVMKVHGNKPIFSCTQCGQEFVKYVHQQEHERDQHGIQHSVKLFRCDVEGCEYETVRKFFLEKHKRIGHTEHKCPHCNLVVKTGDTLQNHIRFNDAP